MKPLAKSVTLLSSLGAFACSSEEPPALLCSISYTISSSYVGENDQEVIRRIDGVLSNRSERGVWDFDGKLSAVEPNSSSQPVDGLFFEAEDGTFELIANSNGERFVVMPGNAILREKELQGVTFQEGGHVSTGTPITADCEVSGGTFKD